MAVGLKLSPDKLTAFREAFAAYQQEVRNVVQRLSTVPEHMRRQAQNLIDFFGQYATIVDRSFRNFTDGLIGVA